jgi:hypothetical protein
MFAALCLKSLSPTFIASLGCPTIPSSTKTFLKSEITLALKMFSKRRALFSIKLSGNSTTIGVDQSE